MGKADKDRAADEDRPVDKVYEDRLADRADKDRAAGGWLDGWVDGWVDGWMVGWMGGWMGLLDRWMGGRQATDCAAAVCKE